MAQTIEGDYQGVSFHDQSLVGCIFIGNFTGADFTRANLRRADLRHGTFQDAIFTGADLKGAKLNLSAQWAILRSKLGFS